MNPPQTAGSGPCSEGSKCKAATGRRIFLFCVILCAAAITPSPGWAQSTKSGGPIPAAAPGKAAEIAAAPSSPAAKAASKKAASPRKAAPKAAKAPRKPAKPAAKAPVKKAPKAAPKAPRAAPKARAPRRAAPKARAPKAAPKAVLKPQPAPPKPEAAESRPAEAPPPKAERPIAPRESEQAKPELPAPPKLSPAQAEASYHWANVLERRGEWAAAMKAYQNSAENGYGPAQKKLGDIYGTGNSSVQRDYETSLRWYQRAREQGIEIPKPFTYPGVRR